LGIKGMWVWWSQSCLLVFLNANAMFIQDVETTLRLQIHPLFVLEDASQSIEGDSSAIAEIFLSEVLAQSFVGFRLLFCRLKFLPPLRR
jgi:hypothetical protein